MTALVPPRLRVLLALLVVAALAAVGGALGDVTGQPRPDTWRLLLIGALAVAADVRLLAVRVGREHYSISLLETSVVAAVALAPRGWAVLAFATVFPLSQLVRRKSLVKAAYNTAALTVAVALAGLVAGAAGPALQGHPLATGVRLLGAGLVAGLLSVVLTAVAIAAVGGHPLLEVLCDKLGLQLLVAVGNAGVGVTVVELAHWDPATLAVAPPLLAAVYAVYWAYLRADEDREVWQRLERASADMIALSVGAVATQAVTHAVEIFASDGAELELAATTAGRAGRWVTGAAGGVDVDTGGSPWVSAGAGDPGIAVSDLGATVSVVVGGQRTSAVVAPLIGPRGLVGHLVLTWAGTGGPTKRERRVLAAYARTVAAGVERAVLHEEVHDQAVRKAFEASHDHLTGLANRSLVQELLRASVERAAVDGSVTALLLLDLDHFKTINDTLGHSTGDRLLREVARRLVALAPEGATVGRLGGDEYALLLPRLRDAATAESTGQQVLRVLSEPIDIEGLRLSIGGSVGVVCSPEDGRTAGELLQRADVALYQAKRGRGEVQRYRSDRDESSVARLELVAELDTAIAGDQIVLHYQPQVDVATGRVFGFEALARWRHPTRGLLPPAEFIDAVEHSGLLRAFTLRVLDVAARDCAAWATAGRPVTVAVNLSARNLLDRQLPDDVATALARHRLPAELVVLEITETTMLGELEVVTEVLAGLRRVGVQLSVDDFGTGFSSLTFLQRVRVNEIKVDRSFVADMLSTDGDAAIVRATVDLGHSLGLRVVAEGVESAQLMEALRGLGCDAAQGYHLGRPADLAASLAVLGLATPALPSARRGRDGVPALA